MKVFVTGRRMGKTQKCIEWAAESDACIVTISRQEADRIFHHAKKQGIKIQRPITFDELLGGKLAGSTHGVVYDNVDMLLTQIARGRRVFGWTATRSGVDDSNEQ